MGQGEGLVTSLHARHQPTRLLPYTLATGSASVIAGSYKKQPMLMSLPCPFSVDLVSKIDVDRHKYSEMDIKLGILSGV